jgi:hypothetical protein
MAVAAAERGRNTGHSRGILRVQDAKNEGEGMATNSQLQYSHQKTLSRISRSSDELCASFLTVPRRFTFGLSSLAYFLQFQLSHQTRLSKYLCREGEIVPGANFQNILKQQLLSNLVQCTWRSFPSCDCEV